MKYIALICAVLLAGCAEIPKPPMLHHYVAKPAVRTAPKPVAPPVVTPAPQSPKQTFKHRWLHLFFRDRASVK